MEAPEATESADPYRLLLAKLEAEEERTAEGARQSSVEECVLAVSGMASGYQSAALWAVRYFEGAEAARAYLRRIADRTGEGR